MYRRILPQLALFILVMASGCRTDRQEVPSPPAVGIRVREVRKQQIASSIRCTGTLSAKTESRLSFKTGGIIHRILADEGQTVREGQLLAELNLEEIRSRVQQAEQVLNKARRDYRRAENLYRDSVATLEQFEDARTALDVARANSRIARFNLQYSAIRAPADGRILKRVAEENEIIAPGHPVFLFASTRNDWVVRANLTDRDVIRVQMLDSARVTFDAYGEEVFGGLISEVGTAADPYTGTYEVEIHLLRKPPRLVNGLFARVDIYPAGQEERIIIPYESLAEGTGLIGYVYLIEEGRPKRRKITIESVSDRGILVKEGLMEGEKLVIEGTQYLREGSPVEIIETLQ